MPRVTPGESEKDADFLLQERCSNVEETESTLFGARDLAASSDEMNYPRWKPSCRNDKLSNLPVHEET